MSLTTLLDRLGRRVRVSICPFPHNHETVDSFMLLADSRSGRTAFISRFNAAKKNKSKVGA